MIQVNFNNADYTCVLTPYLIKLHRLCYYTLHEWLRDEPVTMEILFFHKLPSKMEQKYTTAERK